MYRSATVVGPIRAADAEVPVCDQESAGAPTQDTDLFRVENAREMAPSDARELSRLFFARLRTLEEGTREYQYTRNTLIEMNLSLVQFAARRFRARVLGGGLDMDDVIQVGTIGLIKAIDRYDTEREVEFSTLALPYITGEI
ncbi:sigma factor, partial [Streptomyces sp. NPDC059956]